MLNFENWGLIDYLEAQNKQLELVEKVASGHPETIVFCRHPEVVTLGRGTKDGDVFSFKGPVIEVSRGGRATYHGPNQLVIYPILDLRKDHKNFPNKDLHALLRKIEELGVNICRHFGVEASAHEKARQIDADEDADATGVWANGKKLASVGIAVRKWISYHGIAINLVSDPSAFQGLHPCGFQTEMMTTIEEQTEKAPSFEEAFSVAKNECLNIFT